MKVREAVLDDKITWDSFIDSESGSFYSYFDWKYFYEARGNKFIPLMIETDSNQLVGIVPLIYEKKFLHSVLVSPPEGPIDGILLKKGLSEPEKYDAVRILLKYINLNYPDGCSHLSIMESLAVFEKRHTLPAAVFIDSGLKYVYNNSTGLPCTHVIELKKPFEEHIWMGLWSQSLRKKINRATRNGVTVIQDRKFDYMTQFIDMLSENYKRHGNRRSIKGETEKRINIFKDKTKLFMALQDGQPIVGQLCHYTPSTCFLSKIGSYIKETNQASKLCIKAAIEDACHTGYKYVDFGSSGNANVASFKDSFGTRIPAGNYEKLLSVPRYRVHQAYMLLEELRYDKMYLWNNRQKIWSKILKAT